MAKKKPKPVHYTVPRVAEALGLTPHYTRQLIEQHGITGERIGNSIVLSPADMAALRDAYVAARRPKAEAELKRLNTLATAKF